MNCIKVVHYFTVGIKRRPLLVRNPYQKGPTFNTDSKVGKKKVVLSQKHTNEAKNWIYGSKRLKLHKNYFFKI
jgi:hypothetical protein